MSGNKSAEYMPRSVIHIFSSLVLLVLSPLGAQRSEVHFRNGGNERATVLIRTGNHLILAGMTDAGAADREAGVFHQLDLAGNLIRSYRLGGTRRSRIHAALPLDDGQYLMSVWDNTTTTFDDVAYYRMDSTGNVLASWKHGEVEDDEQVRFLVRVDENSFMAIGNIGTSNEALAIRYDLDGNVIWRRVYSIDDIPFTTFTNAVIDKRAGPNQGDVVLAGFSSLNDEVDKLFVVRISATGELVSTTNFTIPGESGAVSRTLLINAEGNLVVTTFFKSASDPGNILVLTLSPSGEVLSSFALGTAGSDIISGSLLSADGNYLFVGSTGLYDKNRAFVIETNAAGAILRQQYVGIFQNAYDDHSSRLVSIVESPGGGFYFGGTIRGCFGRGTDMLFAYLDEDLERPDGCVGDHPALRQVTVPSLSTTSLGILRPRIETTGTAPEVLPASTQEDEISCPILNLDPDGSSGAPGVGNYRLPAFCYAGPFGIIGEDIDLGPIVPDSLLVALRSPSGRLELPDSGIANRRRFGSNANIVLYPSSLEETERALRSLRVVYPGILPVNEPQEIFLLAFHSCTFSTGAIIYYDVYDNRINSAIPDTTICRSGEITLNARTSGASDYSWSDGTRREQLKIAEAGEYVVTISNPCVAVSDTVLVAELAVPLPFLETFQNTFCIGDSVLADLTLPGVLTYDWPDGYAGPARWLTTSGNYEVQLSTACETAVASISVSAEDCCKIYLPTAFSPNEDGVNEEFRPAVARRGCETITDYELIIFDRWGGEVFRTKDWSQGWNGMLGDRALPIGVFTYTMRYNNGIDEVRNSGLITLVR